MVGETSIWARLTDERNLVKIIFVILLTALLLKPVFWIIGMFYPPLANVQFSWILLYFIVSALILVIYILIFQRWKLTRQEAFILIVVLVIVTFILWKWNSLIPSNFAIEDIVRNKEAVMSALGMG
jgi:hypothetical protein